MKIIFFGTPKFAADILSYLFENKVNILAVVTQSDLKKNNRSYFSEAKKVANLYLNDSEIYQPIKASDPNFLNELKKYEADLFIVVAYGQILKQVLLDIPKIGCINVHASLLPKYRGAAPIHRALLNGETITGITIQKIVRKLDAGSIVSQQKIEIPNEMVFTQLQEKMCELAKPMLIDVIEKYKKNDISYLEQDESQVSFAPKITKEMKQINFENSAKKIFDQIRAFAQKPGAFCRVSINNQEKELKIFQSKILYKKIPVKSFEIINNSLIIGCIDNSLKLIEVQLEGKKKMRASEFIRGVKNKISFL